MKDSEGNKTKNAKPMDDDFVVIEQKDLPKPIRNDDMVIILRDQFDCVNNAYQLVQDQYREISKVPETKMLCASFHDEYYFSS